MMKVLQNEPAHADLLKLLLGRNSGDPESLDDFRLVETGFNLRNVSQLLLSLGALKNQDITKQIIGMSASTLQRRAQDPDAKLDSARSDCLFRFATLVTRAIDVFGDKHSALDWMVKPALGLEGYSPLQLLTNSVGCRIVSTFLGRIEYGVYH